MTQHHDVIVISGVSPGDETFETDELMVGYSIMWNITRIQHDADLGKFGPPIQRPYSVHPEMTPAQQTNINWEKVNRFRQIPRVLMKPALSLDIAINGRIERHIVDGNARVT